ncbi:DUF6527 family protein [Aeromonas hydrophila]|uniref:DUF6527 family protein n=1 Tax=Aeromonas hydrophila TaxID=644 RepID=UPI0021F41E9A|nr:DUF6527 family protein [Aeromonas hydrophila]MCV9382471.1 DUF6527 family protein [Aeromonas hydrophila]
MSEFITLSPVLASASEGTLAFFCKGCNAPHIINVGVGPRPRWSFNGNYECPTFTPSVLVQWDQWEPPCADLEMADKIYNGEIVQTKVSKVCHSFVTDGRIQYLGDCTHELAGQTVDLAPWAESLEAW